MPEESTAERLRRITLLVPWVMAQTDPTVASVCERFDITPEQLSEDLDLLMVCGLPPFGPGDLVEAFIEGDRVAIGMADYLERPPRVTRSEAIALLVMGRAALQLPGFEGAQSLRSALEKLAGALSPEEADRAQRIAERIEVELAEPTDEMLGAIRTAVAERARVRMRYFSQGRSELTERELDPALVFSTLGNWYVVGFDHRSGEERTFRVDRIKELERTGATFEPIPIDASRFGQGPVFVPSERDREVVIEASRDAAWLTEVLPAESVRRAGKLSRVTLRTVHLAWLVRLLLTTGGAARPVDPPELRDEVARAARAALAAYD